MFPQKKPPEVVSPGALVRHVEDEDLSLFGVGIVTSTFIMSASSPWVAKVAWQRPINKALYPAELFTFEGLVVINKSS